MQLRGSCKLIAATAADKVVHVGAKPGEIGIPDCLIAVLRAPFHG